MKLRIAWRLPVQLYNTLVALGTTSIVLMPCAYPLYDGKNDDAKYDNKHDGDDETQYIKHCKHLSALLQRSNFRSDNLRSTYIVS